MMSRPISACPRTTVATAERIPAARAAPSTGTPSSFANIVRVSSSGRGRLPVWVVRIRSVLRCIGGDLNTTTIRRVPSVPGIRLQVPRVPSDDERADEQSPRESRQGERPGQEGGSGVWKDHGDDRVEDAPGQNHPSAEPVHGRPCAIIGEGLACPDTVDPVAWDEPEDQGKADHEDDHGGNEERLAAHVVSPASGAIIPPSRRSRADSGPRAQGAPTLLTRGVNSQ